MRAIVGTHVKQRSVLWVVLAVLVVGAGALVVVVGGGNGDGDGSPPLLRLAAGGSGGGDDRAEIAADVPAIALASVYVAGDDLPALGGEAPAYRLAGEVGTSDVRDLAGALGIDAEPTGTDGSWHVDDGEMALDVDGPDGSWSAYRMTTPRATTASPDAAASSGMAPASGSGSPGDAGAVEAQDLVGRVCPGSYPGADNVVSICEPPLCPDGATPPPTGCAPICLEQPDVASDAPRCEPPLCPQYAPGGETPDIGPDDPCVPPACPGNATDDVRCVPPSTVVAEPRPADPEPEPAEPTPTPTTTAVPPPDLPDEDAARSAALDLLAATGVDIDDAEVTAENLVSMWSVTVEPSVDGRAAPGLAMHVAVGPESRIESATGHLTGPDELGDYPLIDTRDAVTRLNEGWGFATPRQDVAAADAVEAAENGAAGDDGAGASVESSASAPAEQPPIAAGDPPVMTIEPVPNPADPDQPVSSPPGDAPVEPPMPAPAPAEVEVTDAEIVLVTVPSWDGSGTYLVPGYRFTAADGSAPTVPAVTDDVLEPPPAPGEDLPATEPAIPAPAEGGGGGTAGDRVEVGRRRGLGVPDVQVIAPDRPAWVLSGP